MGNYCTSSSHSPARSIPMPSPVVSSFNSHCSPSAGSDWMLSHASSQESYESRRKEKSNKYRDKSHKSRNRSHQLHHRHYYKHRIDSENDAKSKNNININNNNNNNNNNVEERQKTGLNSLVASSQWDINAFFPSDSNSDSSSNSYDYLTTSSCTHEPKQDQEEIMMSKEYLCDINGKDKSKAKTEEHRVIRISRSLVRYIDAWRSHIPVKLDRIPEPNIWSDGEREMKEWRKADMLMSQENFMAMNGNRWDAPHYISALTLETPQTSTINFKTARKPRCL